ncbi:YggS family pyridoxal phosphate-dependent enzyme [bacterium]|nr:YggS family pyridoxal phosphate-dependent enzyme [bacterium]
MEIAARLEAIRRELAAAAAGPVEIVAVTKTRGEEEIRAAAAAGARILGENRVEEAEANFAAGGLRAELQGVELHMIGHLQSKKAKRAVALFDCIQSVDSLSLAQELDKRCAEAGRAIDVLIEVNVSGEERKYGVRPVDAAALARGVIALPRLHLKGLMTMAPFTDDEEAIRATFRGLRGLRDSLAGMCGAQHFPVLSMGMTNDYRIAAAEGSTMVRIGTAIFGPRPARPAAGEHGGATP